MSNHEFRLPDVGEGLEEAEIVEWLVAPGDEVRRDQPLVEILTDKSQTQLPAPVAGTVTELGFAEGDMAHVGDVIVVISSEGDTPTPARVPDRGGEPAPTPTVPPAASVEPELTAPSSSPPATVRVKASPATRRRAREAGVDLRTVAGTGPGGRITAADLEAASAASPLRQPSAAVSSLAAAAPADDLGQLTTGTHPLRGIRRATARAMETAWQIPHIHGMDEIDATNLLNGRRRIKELLGPPGDRLTPLAFFVMAVARALRRYPLMNASIDTDDDTITVHPDVNIGIAVATSDGLIVPVVRHADGADLTTIADEIARLGAAARDRTVSADDLRGGTCTISNYGSLGGRFATPIIRAPEVSIVGFGSIRERPIAIDGSVVARPTLPIATAADHRLIDGDVMTAFQEHLRLLLTDPITLIVSG